MDILKNLPPEALAAMGALVLVQIGLQAFALVTIFRTEESRLRWGKRWIWLAIVLVGELLGPILFFAAGRLDAPVDEALGSGPSAPEKSLDVLYGGKKE